MKVSKSHQTDRAGVAAVDYVVNEKLRWLFREQPISDTGIDAHVEIVSDGQATGRLFALQIKSGPSYFSETKRRCVVYRGSDAHLDYWLNHSLTVVLVLFNPTDQTMIWERISESKINRTPKGWKIEVPLANRFDETSSRALREIAVGSTKALRLQEGLVWMKALRDGADLVLEVEEWVNKTSGRGELLLTSTAPDGAETQVKWEVMFGLCGYGGALQEFFPWATLSIDEDFYEDYDRGRFELENGYRDSETGTVFAFADFHEWQKNLGDGIRPYEEAGGEIARWRLKLTLNRIGKAYLTVVDFLDP